MILVDLIVAFAFVIFIGISYKRISYLVCSYLSKYSVDIENQFINKNAAYKKLNQKLYQLQNCENKIDDIVNQRKEKISSIISYYEKKQQNYELQINERIDAIRKYLTSEVLNQTELHKKYVKDKCKIDVHDVLLKFANLYKKRHNTR